MLPPLSRVRIKTHSPPSLALGSLAGTNGGGPLDEEAFTKGGGPLEVEAFTKGGGPLEVEALTKGGGPLEDTATGACAE
jgi:hypothetical protein